MTVHVKALETQLGVTLFERCRFSKKIVLTASKQRTLQYAERLLALAEETKTASAEAPLDASLTSASREPQQA